MDGTPCWLLTDETGRTVLGRSAAFRWGRGVTCSARMPAISGYACDSIHLPYLLDPLHDRYGVTARVWLSEVADPRYQDCNRVSGALWTTRAEFRRPGWVGGEADARVRLRMALLAAADSHPHAEIRAHLRSLSLEDLAEAADRIERICEDSGRTGFVPQAVCQAGMAVRWAERREAGGGWLLDMPARKYPMSAWYAALAAACACTDLSTYADMAVSREVDARRPAELAASAV